MKTQIQEKIKNYLCRTFDIEQDQLQPDTMLLEKWIIDSIHLLSIAQFMETEFHVELVAGDMDMTNFSTINQMSSLVLRKTSP